MRSFVSDVKNREIETLFIIGANPVYDAPGDLAVADLLGGGAVLGAAQQLPRRDGETLHLAPARNHALESWSDIRAFDGTASIIQPLIRPLYDTRSAHEVLELISNGTGPSSFDVVQSYWQKADQTGSFDDWWRQTLQDGVIANSAASKQLRCQPRKCRKLPPATNENRLL